MQQEVLRFNDILNPENWSFQNVSIVTFKYLNSFVKLFISLTELKTSPYLKVESCNLYIKKYIIANILTQITSTGIFAYVAVVVFKLLSRKVLFTNKKDIRNC